MLQGSKTRPRPDIAQRLPVEDEDGDAPGEIEFADAMRAYLQRYRPGPGGPTCAEVCDVLLNLGYKPPPRSGDFRDMVEALRAALHRRKRSTGKARPAWPDVLDVARALGWRK